MDQTCSESNIIEYIEKELPEAEMLRTENHFAVCADCRRLLAEHRLIRLALNRSSQVEVPPDFCETVMVRLPSPFHRFLQTVRDRVIATATGIILAVLGAFSFLVGTHMQHPEEIVSIRWWSTIFIESFATFTDGFRLLLGFVRLLTTLGIFFLQGLSFILGAMGKLVLFSPQGLLMILLTVVMFVTSASVTLWKYRPGSLRFMRHERKETGWPGNHK